MKKAAAWFLQVGIVLATGAVIILLIRLPQLEGRAVGLTLIQIYTDPLIIFTFLASLPFFYALRQIFLLVGLLEKGKLLTVDTREALRKIQNSALVLAGCTLAVQFFIRLIASQNTDDSTGPLALGFVILVACLAGAAGSYLLQRNIAEKI